MVYFLLSELRFGLQTFLHNYDCDVLLISLVYLVLVVVQLSSEFVELSEAHYGFGSTTL